MVATLEISAGLLGSGSGAPSTTPTLRISVLGPLTIRRGNVELRANDLGGPKPRQVLEILLLNLGSAVSKTRIMDLLWGDNHPAVALPTLESYVSVLRRNLQPGSGRTGPLRTVTGGYAIDRSLVELDLDRFDSLTKQASHATPAAALALLSEALELGSAPLLGDELLPAWAEEERALNTARVALARVQAAECALAVGQADKAVAWGLAATNEDPLNERGWNILVLGLERNGQDNEALRAFERCRRIMDAELGCTPSPALKQAQARLLERTAVPAVTPVTRTAVRPVRDVHPTDAPAAAGQEAAVAQRLRILIVDDHTIFSDLLSGALDREPDLKSLGAAKCVESAVTMFRELRPDVVIMDLHLADGSGLHAAERILAEAPLTRVVMLTGNPSQEALREAARMGICGFLPKDGALGVILDALRHACPGNMIVHPSLVARLGTGPGFAPESAA